MSDAFCPTADKLQLARFLSGLDASGRRIPPSFRSVLFLLIDCPASRHWSSDRIAVACGVTTRTIGRAFSYWRSCGVLRLQRKQRSTAVKTVNVDTALSVAKIGVAIAKRVCAVMRRQAAGLVRTFISDNDHLLKKETPWREPRPPSEALKRLLKQQEGRGPS